MCIFFVYYGLLEPCDLNTEWLNLVFFIALGVLTAAFTEFGDLVESAVKRKLEIKDMGRLLPGHGGILDRIDSTLYAGSSSASCSRCASSPWAENREGTNGIE